ncbi:coagulation factor 5/8 type domain-containing protein [Pseudoxanthomonas yeongjuensis]|uniref:discoidin domain-containing protein n=1 Tax=Pseudoxanthomonas yeongjuensis TaxID=377616 RepID=UPI0013917BD2|nr:discoidin domain-containing protein [Pseudoxanthomonas yeongjuensis]KAF1717751.1 coagulation factor 5/8 type domain-containing protein [Pseudoxanthomonas yeongjuensis]
MTSLFFASALIGLASFGAHAQNKSRVLDDFSDASEWRAVTSNQVSGRLRQVDGAQGKALCLDYDFNGVSGYAGIQRDLALEYPENYRFDFQLRGDSPKNDLQFKLVDTSGDNVWWVNKPKYGYPHEWTGVVYKKRHIGKAWGPDPDRVLRNSAKLEFTVYNNAGGKGSVCFDELTFTVLPAEDRSPLTATASASVANGSGVAGNAVDGDAATAWYADFAARTQPRLTLDMGKLREFGGLKLAWKEGEFASDYLLQLSDDGADWRDVRTVVGGNGGTDYLALPESEARYLRLSVASGPGKSFGLAEATVQPLEFAATPNDFIRSVASESPRGWYPRGFTGEQPYWTIVGLDGGTEQALIGEDGAVEVAKGGFSIEPFVIADRKLVTWADVETMQSLQDGYLPIPSVDWKHEAFSLQVTAFAQGTPQHSQLVTRYRLTNTGEAPGRFALALAVRPLQVNPPTQFLSTVGGVSEIHGLTVREGTVGVEGVPRVRANRKSLAAFASPFDSGDIVQRLADLEWASFSDQTETMGVHYRGPDTGEDAVDDPTGLASGALLYRVLLAPGETYEVDLIAPMTGGFEKGAVSGFPEEAEVLQKRVADQWRGKLDRVHIEVPPQGQDLVDTLRTAAAHMLISRIGPRLQPGTRSYARSWIRDGAMISEGLLRMGREDVVRDYVDFYAPYQFENGMVPCCVDDRGSDPVPENDSHGELIFNIAELYRYNGDKAFLRKMWPHVLGAWTYMEKLRQRERTEANRALNPAFYGMMPASISHEGYSAKPMHSYWDNFWALRGYKDAVEVAQWLGKAEDAKRFAVARDQFRDDLYDSLRAAAKLHDIDFLPGAAELGDFDATSTTIALAPGGEQGRLPKDLLDNTFERYWREFVQRRDGKREWKDYTPYEWRNVAAFVRLGWRERAWETVRFFFKDRAPQPWNQWAEVVSRTPRKPFFVGDLPHAWVASDFVRSTLDMFAYTREIDDSIVLAAGIPADWLEGEGIAIRDLRTPDGKLGYALRRAGGKLELQVGEGLEVPAGGLVLPWPYASVPGKATVNGKPAAWTDSELRILSLPAKVSIEAP